MPKVMLILRGIAGTFDGVDYPNGALDEASAINYAKLRGYEPRVVNASGETGADSDQTQKTLALLKADKTRDIRALYGFSGGGYNVRHVLDQINRMFDLIVILGAPKNAPGLYRARCGELVYRDDPKEGHMAGPRKLLEEYAVLTTAKQTDVAARLTRAMRRLGFPLDMGRDRPNIIYVEGVDWKDGALVRNADRPNAFDAQRILLVVYADGSSEVIFNQDATTHAGAYYEHNKLNPGGAFHIALGHQRAWRMGEYHDQPALRQELDLIGTRDSTENFKRVGTPRNLGLCGVHHHGGYNFPKDNIGKAAAGCQVGEMVAQHLRFMNLLAHHADYVADKNYVFASTVLTAEQVLGKENDAPAAGGGFTANKPEEKKSGGGTGIGLLVAGAAAILYAIDAHPVLASLVLIGALAILATVFIRWARDRLK